MTSKISQFGPLTPDPSKIGLKNASADLASVFGQFHVGLAVELRRRGLAPLWYQPDKSDVNRYFWLFTYESERRDYVLVMNVDPPYQRHAITIHFRHLHAPKPSPGPLLSDAVVNDLRFLTNTAPFLVVRSTSDVNQAIRVVADYLERVNERVQAGWKLPSKGASHFEVQMKAFLNQRDRIGWANWGRPDFLPRRMHIDVYSEAERIAVEIQGVLYHPRDGDEVKKTLLLANGWRLLWVWDVDLKVSGGFEIALQGLATLRSGTRFLDTRKS